MKIKFLQNLFLPFYALVSLTSLLLLLLNIFVPFFPSTAPILSLYVPSSGALPNFQTYLTFSIAPK